jgi:hypothetical protein
MMNQNNNTTAKMTYVTALTYAIENGNLPEGVREKLEALRTQQEKRNNADKKPTKMQVANAGVKELIVSVLRESEKALTVSELMGAHADLSPMVVSTQKVSALLTQLVKAGEIQREEIKRKAYFSVK